MTVKGEFVPAAISMRVYKMTLHQKGRSAELPFSSHGVGALVPRFIDAFKAAHAASAQEVDRSWYLDEKEVESPGCSKGYVHYGMSGFESKIIDSKTKRKKYDRQVTDSEEIPLFYEFWYPPDGQDFALALFQSFQGRSCINLVQTAFRDEFSNQNVDHVVKFKKLIPGGKGAGPFSTAFVKRLTLIRRNASGDLATRYTGTVPEKVDFELSITSRPRKSLGSFGDIFKSIKKPDGVIVYDGISFEEAVADIRVGKRLRRVGVFGGNSEAGVIDITDDVKFGKDGHPTYESLIEEANDILLGFRDGLLGD